jgi:uncharacterized protein YggU (UPF0235/DUF167 family)
VASRPPWLSERDGAPHVRVRVTPRAARDELAGERDGLLLVRVTAPPADGRANAAVEQLLARAASVPRSRVQVVRGASAREKVVRLGGADAAAVARGLGG